jgi:bifunctional non-homologous end joining protein LigD
MPARQFQPILTRATKVASGPDSIRKIKHDGYRLIVQHQDKRVRLFTRNGHDWTSHYPRIVEAALSPEPGNGNLQATKNRRLR